MVVEELFSSIIEGRCFFCCSCSDPNDDSISRAVSAASCNKFCRSFSFCDCSLQRSKLSHSLEHLLMICICYRLKWYPSILIIRLIPHLFVTSSRAFMIFFSFSFSENTYVRNIYIILNVMI